MFADLLINTATVLEDSGAAVDAYGTVVPSWTTVAGLVDIPCRLVTNSGCGGQGREVMVGAEVVIANYKLFLKDVDVTEQSKIRIDDVDYEVLLVARVQDGTTGHHKECLLRVVR